VIDLEYGSTKEWQGWIMQRMGGCAFGGLIGISAQGLASLQG